jgi:hypothetical protein
MEVDPMRYRHNLFCLLAVIGVLVGARSALAETGPAPIGLAIADFSFLDTSGEPTDQAAAHQRRLTDFMAALRRDLAADGRFRLVLAAKADETPESVVARAKAAGASLLVVGGIHKQSTLVQWAKVEAVDLAADRSVLSKLFTFRGDSDEAWMRAETFVVRELHTALGEPLKLAIFDLEYEDFSPAASAAGATPAEIAYLDKATRVVRQLFEKSGRYRLVDTESVRDPAALARTLRDCNGCEAAIAAELGADQSFVGVIRRISRTEYTVRFQVRDAKSGAVLADEFSGLRMGADYSWERGARRLVLDRLLEKKQP